MSTGYPCKHFSIGLPTAAEDQSLTALLQHVTQTLGEHDSISMDDLITISFGTEIGSDAITRGSFTVVFADPESRRTE
ncbi:hypothetical protein ACFCV3_40155 [Kribbella sp. NPDC056345]|uniref:hypothetical protein n=1 Tax=Kribbella sp. NPDC056345 TaxID=3345789 RepID=UPI0035DE7265